MEKIFTLEQWRIIIASTISPLLAFFTPTHGFIMALVIMFGLNIWCGMRADGVIICRCRNFSIGKFKNSLIELLLYLLIIEVTYTTMTMIGDSTEALIVIKSLTYIFIYVYLQNSFKNLIKAYPKNKSFHMIYHVVRLEFKRALPSHIQEVIDRVERDFPNNNN